MERLIYLYSFGLICFLSSLFGENVGLEPQAPPKKTMNCSKGVVFDARFSYFLPLSGRLSETIHGGINYSAAVFIPLEKALNLWGSVDYFDKKATRDDVDCSMRLTMLPVTLGLKFVFPYAAQYSHHVRYRFYIGAGAKYYFVTLKNQFLSYSHTMHRNGFGFAIEAGSLFCITEHLVLDLFTNFSEKRIKGAKNQPGHVQSRHLQVGGWNFGGGLGFKF